MNYKKNKISNTSSVVKKFLALTASLTLLAGIFTSTDVNAAKDDKSSKDDVKYSTLLNVGDDDHGTLSFKDNVDIGAKSMNFHSKDIVTINVNPDEGYVLNDVTITKDNDKTIDYSIVDDIIEFTMPSNDVIVTVTFIVAEGAEFDDFTLIDEPETVNYEDVLISEGRKEYVVQSAYIFDNLDNMPNADVVWEEAYAQYPELKDMNEDDYYISFVGGNKPFKSSKTTQAEMLKPNPYGSTSWNINGGSSIKVWKGLSSVSFKNVYGSQNGLTFATYEGKFAYCIQPGLVHGGGTISNSYGSVGLSAAQAKDIGKWARSGKYYQDVNPANWGEYSGVAQDKIWAVVGRTGTGSTISSTYYNRVADYKKSLDNPGLVTHNIPSEMIVGKSYTITVQYGKVYDRIENVSGNYTIALANNSINTNLLDLRSVYTITPKAAGDFRINFMSEPKGSSFSANYIYGSNQNLFVAGSMSTSVKSVSSKIIAYSTLDLVKVSEKPEYTDGNAAYSLIGAKYGVYTDANTSVLAKDYLTGVDAVLTVKDNKGTTNKVTLDKGTYYVKELSQNNDGVTSFAEGYKVNDNVYTYLSEPGKDVTKTLDGEFVEPIINDPVALAIQKGVLEMDAGNQAMGNITDFSGAKFEFAWYPGLYNSKDEAVASGEPKLKAVWETNEEGYVRFVQDAPIEGSWDYKDGAGNNAAPLGTLVITELEGIPGTMVKPSSIGQLIQFTADENNEDSVATAIDPWPGSSGEAITGFANESIKGGVSITKLDSDLKTSSPQGNATLKDVEYTIFNKSEAMVRVNIDGSWVDVEVGDPVMTIKTVYDEKTDSYIASTGNDILPFGTYEIKETKAPVGYELDSEWSETFDIVDNSEMITIENSNDVLRYGVMVGKIDAETEQYIPLGGTILADTTFEVINVSNEPVVVDGVVIDPNGRVGELNTVEEVQEDGSVKYVAKSIENWLPYGKYKVREIAAPTGYLLTTEDEAWSKTFTVGYESDSADASTVDKNSFADLTDEVNAASNQVKREDFYFQKKFADRDNERAANIPFVITSNTTGESHIIVTDENGTFGSDWVENTSNTNANDPDSPISNGAVEFVDGEYKVVDESKLNSEAGLWFTGMSPDMTKWTADGLAYEVNGKFVYVDNSLRSLPYDTYTMTELETEANKGYHMMTVTLTMHKYGNNNGNGISIDYGTLNNQPKDELTIRTLATGADGESKTVPVASNVEVFDFVSYTGLTPGKEYVMNGKFMIKGENGEPDVVAVDSDGNEAVSKVIFTPTTADGKIQMNFNIDTSKLDGRDIVAFEYLSESDKPEVVIASHEDINDKDQTLRVDKDSKTPTVPVTLETGVSSTFLPLAITLMGLITLCAGFILNKRNNIFLK